MIETTNKWQGQFNEGKISMYPQSDNAMQFRLNEPYIEKDYYIAEVCKREIMITKLSKYIAAFDYFDKTLWVLSVASGSVTAALLATAIGVPVEKDSASFDLIITISNRIGKQF